jgi:peptidoglycan/LPS O-acetylase OafA/YrhL
VAADLLYAAAIRNYFVGMPGDVKVSGNADFGKNNLDLLRLILASIVALFHLGVLAGMPAFNALSWCLSPHFAVRAFFVISGLLIYRSYTRSSSIGSYLDKRARRIYPAYFTIVVLAAVGLCLLSSLPLSHYFGAGFWKYLGANLIFLNFLAPGLPGVFATNGMIAVNGALWTLKIEVAFYLFVPVLHYLCNRFGAGKVIGAVFCLSCIWKYGFSLLDSMYTAPGIYTLDSSRSVYSQLGAQFPAQLAYFSAGILLFLYFDSLKLHFIGISCITAILYLVDHWFAGGVLDVLWISGFVFVFGFWHYFGNSSKHGDFSYGVYIVHFPILQTLFALGLARQSPFVVLVVSLSVIGLASFLMWHLVESRFLANSSHYRLVSAKASV